MNCILHWNALTPQEWDSFFQQIPRSNLLQSYAYARAYSVYAQQKPRFGHIEIKGKITGLFQIFETSLLFGAVHTVILDRGPLWLPGFGGAAHTKLFFETFNKTFPRRFGRARRIIPEIEDGMTAQKILESVGLQKREGRPGYETIWLDLNPDEETLRNNLKANWRNKLAKAEKSPLETSWDNTGKFFTDFKIGYAVDKSARGYPGPSPKLLDQIARFSSQTEDMMIGKAKYGPQIAAAVLFIRHGRSATYLAGWTVGEGRTYAAHHLLLWQGLTRLKQAGIKELDLGGINDESAKGVKTFKEGFGGVPVRLAGHYR